MADDDFKGFYSENFQEMIERKFPNDADLLRLILQTTYYAGRADAGLERDQSESHSAAQPRLSPWPPIRPKHSA